MKSYAKRQAREDGEKKVSAKRVSRFSRSEESEFVVQRTAHPLVERQLRANLAIPGRCTVLDIKNQMTSI